MQLVTLDLKFRLYWFDDRFNVTLALFKALAPSYSANGIDMTFIYASGQLNIWLPDLDFSDAQTVTELQVSLRLKPNGLIYWSRHLSLTLSQTTFNYADYPLDSQTIALRFESYAFPTTLIQLAWASPPVQLYNSGSGVDFAKNPVWSYDSYYTAIDQVDNSLTNNDPRYFTEATLYIKITRMSGGMIVRLVIPTLLLVIMGACSFWGKRVDRSKETVTLVLATAALYIAVMQSIPSVGYLTKYDKFSLAMITILVAISLVHRFISHVDKGADQYPAMEILIRLGESVCRISLMPLIIAFFIDFVGSYFNVILLNLFIVLFSLVVFVIAWREVAGINQSLTIFDAIIIKKVAEYKPSTLEDEKIIFGTLNFTNGENLLSGRNQINQLELLLFNFRHTMMLSARGAVTLSIIERLPMQRQRSKMARPSDSDQYGLEMMPKINNREKECSAIDSPMNEH